MARFFFALAAVVSFVSIAPIAQVAAQPAGGMDVMHYYVGTWACTAGAPGEKPQNATATQTLDNGVLRQWIFVPATGKMTSPYTLNITVSYDAKKHRYVNVSNDNIGSWGVSYAKPFTGNIEQWVDQAAGDGNLGHSQIVRTKDSYTFTGYAGKSMKVVFKGTCNRSM